MDNTKVPRLEQKRVVVVTTIQPPTACMRRLCAAITPFGATLLAVGDKKGPERFDLPEARLVSFAEQAKLPFRLAQLLPAGHYSRKNLGYLLAMQQGANSIYETDDDNAPLPHWQWRESTASVISVKSEPWLNVYKHFSDEVIWPRGLPLDQASGQVAKLSSATEGHYESPIQQGLADGSPDVDAIWRLLNTQSVEFKQCRSVRLEPGTWCPFNSQSTWWWQAAFPLLYLPTNCSFRMTDIWRSFVAQRCLWELGKGVVFHASEVFQDRNAHNLLKDFQDEIPGYLGNDRIRELLAAINLKGGQTEIPQNMLRCYEVLGGHGFLPPAELKLIEAWIHDVTSL